MRCTCVVLGAALILVLAHAAGPHAQAARATAGTGARSTSGNIEHGRYIVEHVAHCGECHSGRDGRGTIIETERFMGGLIPFAPPWPNDWAMRAPRNKGLPGYDDALARRLLTQGSIGRNGAQLRPPMPRFRMTDNDAADVIAFMRSLP
jgi:hypothetical protein